MMLEGVLRLTGASLIVLAAAHLPFSRHFHWREELARLSLINRQIFYVHCGFICLILLLMGSLCLLWPETLLQPSPLGLLVTGGLTVFWGCRLAAQWFVYDAALWRGKRFETLAHVLFTGLWSFYCGVFGVAWWLQWQAQGRIVPDSAQSALLLISASILSMR